MSHTVEGLRTWDDGKRCDECCNGDRCDDPTHRDRTKCPHCKGTGWALWTEAGRRDYAAYLLGGNTGDKRDAILHAVDAATLSAPPAGTTGDVLVRLKRPEGYEDVHPELLLDDAGINPAFKPEIVSASPSPAAREADKRKQITALRLGLSQPLSNGAKVFGVLGEDSGSVCFDLTSPEGIATRFALSDEALEAMVLIREMLLERAAANGLTLAEGEKK